MKLTEQRCNHCGFKLWDDEPVCVGCNTAPIERQTQTIIEPTIIKEYEREVMPQ